MTRKTKQQGKNNANTGKVPQEVAKNKSTLKSVAHDDHQYCWHQSVQDFPPGKIIDIPYLKQLAVCAIVPIAYCKNVDIDIVNNFVPAYLLRFTRHIWQLLDEEDYILSQHNWEYGDNSILNLFGTYMQHPEEKFVHYFGGTPGAAFEQGSPRQLACHHPRQRWQLSAWQFVRRCLFHGRRQLAHRHLCQVCPLPALQLTCHHLCVPHQERILICLREGGEEGGFCKLGEVIKA